MLESIKTKAEYDIALERVYKLMQENITPNSKESEDSSFVVSKFVVFFVFISIKQSAILC